METGTVHSLLPLGCLESVRHAVLSGGPDLCRHHHLLGRRRRRRLRHQHIPSPLLLRSTT